MHGTWVYERSGLMGEGERIDKWVSSVGFSHGKNKFDSTSHNQI